MDFDASQLQQNGKPVLGHKIVWGTASWPTGPQSWKAPLSGMLTFTTRDGRTVALHGPLIQSIALGPGKAEVRILIRWATMAGRLWQSMEVAQVQP
jgi:hypothetical protein